MRLYQAVGCFRIPNICLRGNKKFTHIIAKSFYSRQQWETFRQQKIAHCCFGANVTITFNFFIIPTHFRWELEQNYKYSKRDGQVGRWVTRLLWTWISHVLISRRALDNRYHKGTSSYTELGNAFFKLLNTFILSLTFRPYLAHCTCAVDITTRGTHRTLVTSHDHASDSSRIIRRNEREFALSFVLNA